MTHDQAISDASRKSTPAFRSFMLSEDDPRVVGAFKKLEGRAMLESEVKESLTNGDTWPRSHAMHKTAREQMARRVGVEAIASQFVAVSLCLWSCDQVVVIYNLYNNCGCVGESHTTKHQHSQHASLDCIILQERMLLSLLFSFIRWCTVPSGPALFNQYSTKWSRLLPPREQDILYLHLWMWLGLELTFQWCSCCCCFFTTNGQCDGGSYDMIWYDIIWYDDSYYILYNYIWYEI